MRTSVSESVGYTYIEHHLAATPDAVVTDESEVPAEELLEVKCPSSKMHMQIHTAAEDKTFCISNCNGKLMLKRNHWYYYQVWQVRLYQCSSGKP